jgi:hypothetical protein
MASPLSPPASPISPAASPPSSPHPAPRTWIYTSPNNPLNSPNVPLGPCTWTMVPPEHMLTQMAEPAESSSQFAISALHDALYDESTARPRCARRVMYLANRAELDSRAGFELSSGAGDDDGAKLADVREYMDKRLSARKDNVVQTEHLTLLRDKAAGYTTVAEWNASQVTTGGKPFGVTFTDELSVLNYEVGAYVASCGFVDKSRCTNDPKDDPAIQAILEEVKVPFWDAYTSYPLTAITDWTETGIRTHARLGRFLKIDADDMPTESQFDEMERYYDAVVRLCYANGLVDPGLPASVPNRADPNRAAPNRAAPNRAAPNRAAPRLDSNSAAAVSRALVARVIAAIGAAASAN